MRTPSFQNPILPFATSFGAMTVQFVGILSCGGLTKLFPGLRDFWDTCFLAILVIPLVSLVGIVSAIVQLKKKISIGINVVGLLLNVLYLVGSVLLVIFGSQRNAWNF
ncbi:MAG TPA: hypothetical protein VHD32_04240 [Candidatus Didemnitutus sp.]|nr:hypothetical protein [Candidatus Didemnitutus sp.]